MAAVSELAGQRPSSTSTSFEDLARLADHHEQLVLSRSTAAADLFYVVVDGIAYRYGAASGRAADERAAAPAPRRRRRSGIRNARRRSAPGLRDDRAGLRAAS